MTADPEALLEPVKDMDEYLSRVQQLGQHLGPTIFGMRTRLPSQGRVDIPVAATEWMTIVVKAYGGGGENELHAHPHEDHAFIVLQGSARFFGEDGELGHLQPHQGILVPRGVYYCFNAESDGPLVMIRFGCVTDPNADPHERIDSKQQVADGFDTENKIVDLVLSDKIFE